MLFNAQFEHHICIFEAFYVWNLMVLLTCSVKMTLIKNKCKAKKNKPAVVTRKMPFCIISYSLVPNCFIIHYIRATLYSS